MNNQPKSKHSNSKPLTIHRRDFIQFLGGMGAISLLGPSCALSGGGSNAQKQGLSKGIKGLKKGLSKDTVTLAPGLQQNILIREGESLGKGLNFGCNNDFTQFLYVPDLKKYFLWVNHEYFDSVLLSNRNREEVPSRETYLKEREMVGGSLVEIQKDVQGKWTFAGQQGRNLRLSGSSSIALSHPIAGTQTAIGSFANCSGGLTPWNTILTCEENYEQFYGEWQLEGPQKGKVLQDKRGYNWFQHEAMDPRHYGWVVEFDPVSGKSQKLIGLGRFAHECAKVIPPLSESERSLNSKKTCVVYSGDDHEDECLYKFISDSATSLVSGELFVANIEKGEWLSLDIKKQKTLQKHFKNQEEVLTHCRKAAQLLGGTPLARPEDIEQDPISRDIFIALTNNKSRGNYHGSILKLKEDGGDPTSLKFSTETYISGGPELGFSSPDNMAFDQKGNLWFTTDVPGAAIDQGPYKGIGNNGLFVIPRKGPQQGEVLQMASAPNDAELTGPCFSDDQKTLFLSVQHPGELSQKGQAYTSHWPNGGQSKPLSAVLTLTGSTLEKLTQS